MDKYFYELSHNFNKDRVSHSFLTNLLQNFDGKSWKTFYTIRYEKKLKVG